MFIFDAIYAVMKLVIVCLGTFFLCAITLGKSQPFHKMARRIDRRNAKKMHRYYLNHN